MTHYAPPLQDFQTLLFETLTCDGNWSSWAATAELDRPTAEAILEEAGRFCQSVLAPLNRTGDEQGCRLQDGEVLTADGFRQAYADFADAGWCALAGSPAYGAMGLPKTLVACVEEMVQGACMSFGLAPMLSSGACVAIDAHASDELKALYLPRLYSGEWSGAMDLTEPHAGTDLGLMHTKAEPRADGTFGITGSKIFITWGEHDMAANIVHLVLAKLPNAPAGSRGISMFLVPKFLPAADGTLGERNRLGCGALEKKMGIKGSATCVMNFDAATGWLLGQPNQGLATMFTMMNHERLAVGIQAVGVAEASYRTALAYARERLQGRSPSGAQSPELVADPLLVHPDVRRMLMTMKACTEAGRACYLYTADWLDRAHYAADEREQTKAQKITSLLTPVVKAFLSDQAFDCVVLGQQVLGGHGYIREWEQEQRVRDLRITQIYEGTNGIQALDLVGRKTVACDGELMALFLAEVDAWMAREAATLAALRLNEPLRDAILLLQRTTDLLLQQARHNACAPGAAANSYLHLFGYVLYAFLWAQMGCAAHARPDGSGAAGKIKTARFYYQHLLPRIHALGASIAAGPDALMAVEDSDF